MWSKLVLLLSLTGCHVDPSTNTSAPAADETLSPQEKQAWIAKAARVLRYGEGIESADEMASFMGMDREAIVEKLMADPRFGNTVLDFNLYFLGFKPDSLFSSQIFDNDGNQVKSYAASAMTHPQAMTAARNLLTGGDYFALFDLNQPFYASHTRPPFIDNDPASTVTPQEKRAKILAEIGDAYDQLLAKFKPTGTPVTYDRQAGCDAFGNDRELIDQIQNGIFNSGIDSDSVLPVVVRWHPTININCGSSMTGEEIYKQIGEVKDRVAKIFAAAEGFTTENYKVNSILDVKDTGFAALDPDYFGTSMNYSGYWNLLQNSSTNYNRRRAAYMLRTYFCDDLTPIAVVQPAVHASGAHASDAGCQSCHYKLDPMAAFFRHRAFLGFNGYGKAFMTFDDNATIMGDTLTKYLDSWKAPADSGRTWNAGYVRSTTAPEANTYEPEVNGVASAEPMADLHKIIRDAKESRQCLVRRMGEYFLGTKQVFDGGWMEQLTNTFDQEQNSSAAARQVIKSLVLSRTFSQKNPNPAVCYDPPSAASSPIPCEVSFVLEKNCKSCHAHLFKLDQPDVLNEMMTRLKSADPEVRMPYQADTLSDPDRVRLVKWLENKLGQQGGSH